MSQVAHQNTTYTRYTIRITKFEYTCTYYTHTLTQHVRTHVSAHVEIGELMVTAAAALLKNFPRRTARGDAKN